MRSKATYIIILNVATILTKMDRDAIGPPEMRLNGSPYRIRIHAAPRLAQRRHVVNIDAEFDHDLPSSEKRC
jgi:hypothetical protein